jgi:hypothetical protein
VGCWVLGELKRQLGGSERGQITSLSSTRWTLLMSYIEDAILRNLEA